MSTIQPELSSLQRRRNLNMIAALSFIRGAHSTIFAVIWQPFALSLGASMPTIGLLNSIGGMNGIFTTLSQSFGGWLSDRIGRKPFLLASGFLIIISYALYAVAGALALWPLLLVAIVLLGLSALSRPAISSMTAESAPKGRHGSAFSLIMVASQAPGILAPAVGGWFTELVGYVGIFPLLLAMEMVALLLVWRFVAEARQSPHGVNATRIGRAFARSIVPPKGLGGFFAATAVDSFSWAMGWGLLTGMLRDSYQFSVEQLGLLASASSLSWALLQMPVGRYVDRHGLKRLLIVSEATGIPMMLIGITQRNFEAFLIFHLMFGITAATWVPVVSTYLTRAVPAAERAEAFGRLNMFRGLVAFPASWVGGILYEWGRIQAPLAANLVGGLVVIAILILFVEEPGQASGSVV